MKKNFPQSFIMFGFKVTNISNDEFDKAKSACFSDTVMMKPLRTSMVGACLQQVLGTGKKRQPGKEMPDGSTSV
jgi:arabidopsis histidine kinase 2/3/4 (cytokinin receptor)